MAEITEKTTVQTTTVKTPVPQDADFDIRHKKELGVGKFASVTAFNTFFPWITGGAGAAAGYFALARPATMVLRKIREKWVESMGAMEALGEGLWNFLKRTISSGTDMLSTPDKVDRAKKDLMGIYAVSGENAAKVIDIIKGQGTGEGKLVQIAKALGKEIPQVPKFIKWGTAGVLGFIGLLAGGITVGYREWRKQESARLAADEINRDIANMELFRPSDPELMQENKRLHAMVAALPTIDPASAEQQGRVEERQKQAAVS